MANGLDPDQDRRFVGPDLDYNCLRYDFVQKNYWIPTYMFLMLHSHYHDQRHDWNRGINHGQIAALVSAPIKS